MKTAKARDYKVQTKPALDQLELTLRAAAGADSQL